MNRILLGLGGVSAMVLIVVGCTTETTVTPGNTVADTSVPTTPDTSAPKADTSTAKPDAKVQADTAVVIATPECYNPSGEAVAGIVSSVTSKSMGFGYHAAMPYTSACSATEVEAILTQVRATSPDGGRGPFRTFQVSGDSLTGLSASCKTCVNAEYQQTGENREAYKWGVSGLRTNADVTQYDLPSNENFTNFYGCLEARGILTGAEAGAINDAETCVSALCPASDEACGAADPETGAPSAKASACNEFALSEEGGCFDLGQTAVPAYQKVQAANGFAATACGSLAGVIDGFCGIRAAVSDAGVGQ